MADPRVEAHEADVSRRALDSIRSESALWSRSKVTVTPSAIRDWIHSQRANSVARVGFAIAAVMLVALVCAATFVVSSDQATVEPLALPSATSAVLATTTTAPGLVVDVGGAVRQPGVYRLSVGTRVVDALEAAGGPAEDVDLERVNLASMLSDGQRVWIPRRGEVAPQGVAGVVDPASAPAAPGPIDLNSATADQLDTLAGIGPSTAKAIIERRTQLGRFRSVDDLLSVKGIGESKLDSIRSSVVVR